MKAYQKYINIGTFAVVILMSSCEKWLDVAPQTQIEADRVFEKEVGFQDALTGVYVKMGAQSLYGRELTFGMVDGLGAQFNGLGTANEYYSTINYDYDHETFIAKSNTLFENSYNTIANINLLIQNVNEKGEDLFSGVNYHTIRGEAYGLRALLHFDLVRLYGSAIASEGETELAIPYMDVVGVVPQERLTTRAVLDKVLADLKIAEQELAGYDPIVPANVENASTYLRDRQLKFNYYAVKALQARVQLYAGNKVEALAAAKAVIESNVFAWTPSSQIATSGILGRNMLFTQELVFSLSIGGLANIVHPYYDEGVSGNLLAKSDWDYKGLFVNQDDYRFLYSTVYSEMLWRQYSIKLLQNGFSEGANRMPLIRKSELYYIAAECVSETNPSEAVGYLNEVLSNRNGGILSTTLTPSEVQNEIKTEYRKEFIGEGQLFYYYKRTNASQIDGVWTTINDDIYVLPLPDREVLYGLN